MTTETKIDLLARVARSNHTEFKNKPVSILSIAAVSYGARPEEETTTPTGFDPYAVLLFEAIVEGAYLVATADGVFDDEERAVFERVVTVSCGGAVSPKQTAALLGDLADQLAEDGLERRIEAVGEQVRANKAHAIEVIRIAVLLAQASEDISSIEREVLLRLASACALTEADVDDALREVRVAVSSPMP